MAARAGLRRGAVYLVRPDGYVGLADPDASPVTQEQYLDTRGVQPLNAAHSEATRSCSRLNGLFLCNRCEGSGMQVLSDRPGAVFPGAGPQSCSLRR